MVTLQANNEFGLVSRNRAEFTINTAGDFTEGIITTAGIPEENVLELVTQSWKDIFIEARNEDDTNTADFRIYVTKKFNRSVPATGDAFWDVTGVHWEKPFEVLALATNTNIVVQDFINKGYTYMVVTVESNIAGTETIVRAIMTQR